MSDIDRFLEPFPDGNPAGVNLRIQLYDKIKAARRSDDSGPRGVWEQREAKTSDFKLVVKLSEDALLTKTKDLQIAVWLTEAWIYEDGVSGIVSGLQLVYGLIQKFWDNLYPEVDNGDFGLRAAPLEWLGSYFDPGKGSSPILALRKVPLTQNGFDWFKYHESRKVGYEREVAGNKARVDARALAIKEGKLAPEDFDKNFAATPKKFYRDLEKDIKAARQALNQLDELCREKFAQESPSFSPLNRAIEELENLVQILLAEKLKKDPDPPEPVAAEPASVTGSQPEDVVAEAVPVTRSAEGAQLDPSKFAGGEIATSEQAALHVVAAAQYLRRKNPASPISYLLLRALRWGEVREAGDLASADLPAPGSEIRMTLRAAAANKNWKQVLEVAESAMSGAIGRGWLDLQRYAITACDELQFAAAAKALRSELKCFLADFSNLPKAILKDDTGTANPETLEWLKKENLIA